MNLTQFYKHLRKKTPRKVWFLFGEDSYQVYLCEQKLRQKFLSPGVQSYHYNGLFDKWASIFDGLETESMFSSSRFIVVSNFDKFTAEKSKFFEEFASVDNTVLVVSASYKKYPEKWPKLPPNVGDVYCKYLDPQSQSFLDWLDFEMEDRTMSLSEDFKSLLIKVYGAKLDLIMNNLNQIALLSDGSEEDETLFRDLLKSSRRYTIFDLVEFICLKDFPKASSAFEYLFQSKDFSISSLLKLLEKQVFLVFKYLILNRKKLDRDSIAKELGINKFFIDSIKKQSEFLKDHRVKRMVSIISDACCQHPAHHYECFNLVHELCL